MDKTGKKAAAVEIKQAPQYSSHDDFPGLTASTAGDSKQVAQAEESKGDGKFASDVDLALEPFLDSPGADYDATHAQCTAVHLRTFGFYEGDSARVREQRIPIAHLDSWFLQLATGSRRAERLTIALPVRYFSDACYLPRSGSTCRERALQLRVGAGGCDQGERGLALLRDAISLLPPDTRAVYLELDMRLPAASAPPKQLQAAAVVAKEAGPSSAGDSKASVTPSSAPVVSYARMAASAPKSAAAAPPAAKKPASGVAQPAPKVVASGPAAAKKPASAVAQPPASSKPESKAVTGSSLSTSVPASPSQSLERQMDAELSLSLRMMELYFGQQYFGRQSFPLITPPAFVQDRLNLLAACLFGPFALVEDQLAKAARQNRLRYPTEFKLHYIPRKPLGDDWKSPDQEGAMLSLASAACYDFSDYALEFFDRPLVARALHASEEVRAQAPMLSARRARELMDEAERYAALLPARYPLQDRLRVLRRLAQIEYEPGPPGPMVSDVQSAVGAAEDRDFPKLAPSKTEAKADAKEGADEDEWTTVGSSRKSKSKAKQNKAAPAPKAAAKPEQKAPAKAAAKSEFPVELTAELELLLRDPWKPPVRNDLTSLSTREPTDPPGRFMVPQVVCACRSALCQVLQRILLSGETPERLRLLREVLALAAQDLDYQPFARVCDWCSYVGPARFSRGRHHVPAWSNERLWTDLKLPQSVASLVAALLLPDSYLFSMEPLEGERRLSPEELLHLAAGQQRWELVRVLVGFGVSADARDFSGVSVRQLVRFSSPGPLCPGGVDLEQRLARIAIRDGEADAARRRAALADVLLPFLASPSVARLAASYLDWLPFIDELGLQKAALLNPSIIDLRAPVRPKMRSPMVVWEAA